MKHIGLLCAAMLTFAIPTSAAEIDLTSMSIEELSDLQGMISAEIANRGGDNKIPSGDYITGKAIREGTFKVTCLALEEDYDHCRVMVKEIESKDTTSFTTLAIGESVNVTLTEGTRLVLCEGDFSICESTSSWAP